MMGKALIMDSIGCRIRQTKNFLEIINHTSKRLLVRAKDDLVDRELPSRIPGKYAGRVVLFQIESKCVK